MADDAWQSAWVEVVPDFTDFRKTANSQMTGILSGAGDDAGKAGSKRAGASFVGGIGGWLPGIAAGIAALGVGRLIGDAIRTGVDLAVQSIDLASDLNESKNAIKVAYGDAFKDVEKLAQGSNIRLGLSEGDFNAIATQFSAFAQTIESKNPSKFIDQISERGADFASVFNIDVKEALQLFQSGLAGENEPLRKYGIDLSAASVNAFALANGIGDASGELTEAQKQQARYGLLLQQTNKVQGDFKNTSGELANSQRIFGASVQDTQAKFGTYLLPALTAFMAIANDQILPVLGDLAEEVGPILADALVQSTPAILGLVTALAPLLPDLVKLGVEVLPPLVALLIAISPALIDFAANTASAFSNMNDFFNFLSGNLTLQEFGQNIAAGTGSVSDFAQGIQDWVTSAVSDFREFSAGVLSNVGGAVNYVAGLPGRILASIGSFGSLLYSSGQALIQGFLNGINSMFGRIGSSLSGVMDFIAGFFPHSPAERGPLSGSGWSDIQSAGQALFAQFAGGFQSGVSLSPALEGGVSSPGLRSTIAGIGPTGTSSSLNGTRLVLEVGGQKIEGVIREQAGVVVTGYNKAREGVAARGYGGN